METKNKLRPAINLAPSYFIKEQMEYRDWTPIDLAQTTGITITIIDNILNDKQTITTDIAEKLYKVFGLSAEYWMNLETSYKEWFESACG